MEGPLDPNTPDAGATEPVAQDGDLHALLERLLGQGDLRPAASGSADALWPDLFPVATATPDDVSTIVPAPEALAAEPLTAPFEADLGRARTWEPVVIDSRAESTNVDDIHAAILASVSVDLEPIVLPVAEVRVVESAADALPPALGPTDLGPTDLGPTDLGPTDLGLTDLGPTDLGPTDLGPTDLGPTDLGPTDLGPTDLWPTDLGTTDVEPTDALLTDTVPTAALLEAYAPSHEAPAPAEPVALEAHQVQTAGPVYFDDAAFELTGPVAFETADAVGEPLADLEPTPISSDFIDSLFASDPALALEAPADAAGAPIAFSLTPFEEDAPGSTVDMGLDEEALWAAALPELGLDAAPLLGLDGLDDDDTSAPTAVVLPWPSHEPRADAPSAPQDLIEAALSGLNADLTAEAVEPLRTPDVAAATAHVVFRLGSRIMAIPLAAVSEIARPPRTTRLPHVPAWVLGIANLRGDIVSMLDLEGFFSGKTGKSSHEQRMLALRPVGDEVRTAVLVDSVDGIQAFEDARISRVTRGYDAEVSSYARGLYQLGDELVVVLDADRLLQSKPMRQFEDGAGAR